MSSTDYAKAVGLLKKATRQSCLVGMTEAEVVNTAKRAYATLSEVAEKERAIRRAKLRKETLDSVQQNVTKFLKERPDLRDS